MGRTRNQALAVWLADHQMKVGELVKQMNEAVGELTGRYGTLNERGVHKWLSGETGCPQERYLRGLERVTGLNRSRLGFRPRGRTQLASPEEDPVYRRAFLAAASIAGAALAAPAAASQRRRVGSADVDRLSAKLAAVVSMDDRYGGIPELEHHAAALAQETIDLQQHGIVSSRIRSELYGVAAAFTTSAMWAAIDGNRLGAAQDHLNQAVTLAGLSGSPEIEFKVWGQASILYDNLGRRTDAVAAADASRATAITRRDPLYASLSLARLARSKAELGDPTALRMLDHAQAAFDRADPGLYRPPWMGFVNQAELDRMASHTNLRLGRFAQAEQLAHRYLTHVRPDFERDRALAHARLALAQLGQGDVEPAVASARSIPPAMARMGRIRSTLNGFTTRLNTLAAGSAAVRTWNEHRSTYS